MRESLTTSDYGNRAYSCKWCHRSKRLKLADAPHTGIKRTRSCSNVSGLIPDDIVPKPKRLYSVRIRGRGPDYRTLVSVGEEGVWECHNNSCKIAQDEQKRSTSVSIPTQQTVGCEHVHKAQALEVESSSYLRQANITRPCCPSGVTIPSKGKGAPYSNGNSS